MKNHRFNPFRTGLAAATLTFTLLAAGPAVAATVTWDGGASTGAWATGDNWTGIPDNTAPVAGDKIVFAGDVETATTNDLAAETAIAGIDFTNDGTVGMSAFTLSGNAITLGGNITTTRNTAGTTITNIIDLDMILNGNRTITTNHLSSAVQHNLTINGIISETGTARNLTKAGSGQLTLTGSNSFSGTLGIFGTLNANSIANVGTNSALGTGNTIRIGVSGGTGTLNMTAGAASTDRQIQIGNGADPAHSGGARINNNTTNGAGTLVFTNGNFNVLNGTAITGRTLTLGGANTDANEIQGIIADNSASGTIGVTKEDAGTWVLSGANTYTGDTTVNAGMLAVDGDSIADTGKLVIAGGLVNLTGAETVDTLFFGAVQQAAGTYSADGAGGTIASANFTGSGTLIVSSGPSAPATKYWIGTGIWTDANSWSLSSGEPYDQTWTSGDAAVFDVTPSTITGANTDFSSITANVPVTFTAGGTLGTGGTVATITVNGGVFTLLNFGTQAISTAAGTGFIKNGIGTWALQGSPYLGNFTINDGTVAMAGSNALGGTSVSRTLTLNGGTIRSNGTTVRDLGTRFGGGIIIGGDITLGGSGLVDGAMTFGNDVTLGAATRQITTDGTVTLSGIISGDPGAGITKAGDGTLTLSGTNTYTGDTTVNAGTLALDGDSIADTGKLVINGGLVDLTGAETVNTLFFGAAQQPSGTYSTSSVPDGATITTASFTGTGTLIVPPSSGYAAWQAANSTDQAANLDHDNDGVSNGVEHFLGGTGNTTGFTTPLPGVTNTAGTLSVTWVRHPDFPGFPGNYGTAVIVETSATLADPWTPAVEGVGAGFVEITGNDLKYTFPAGTKNFARLKVVTNP